MSVWQAAIIFVSKLKVSKDGLRADLRAKEADLEAIVVQLRANERELLGKDADISRLLVELQSCQTEMLRMQVCVCVCVCTSVSLLKQCMQSLSNHSLSFIFSL